MNTREASFPDESYADGDGLTGWEGGYKSRPGVAVINADKNASIEDKFFIILGCLTILGELFSLGVLIFMSVYIIHEYVFSWAANHKDFVFFVIALIVVGLIPLILLLKIIPKKFEIKKDK